MEKTICGVTYMSVEETTTFSCKGCVAMGSKLCDKLADEFPCRGIIWKAKEKSNKNKYLIAQEVHKEYVAGWSPGDTTKFEDWLNKKILESDHEDTEDIHLKSKFEKI